MTGWTTQSPHSDPGRHGHALDGIASEPEAVVRVVQGLLIHGGAFKYYGLAEREFSRETLTVESRLAGLLADDGSPLVRAREPQHRCVGTCRDYALMACSIFRHQGIAARVRCGFASYLGGSAWEDHWVCEIRPEGRWIRIDAQLDVVMREALGARVSPVDLPPSAFVDAAEAWRVCRSDRADPGRYGHGEAAGLWFVFVNLVRDRLALRDEVTSAWDGWRVASTAPPNMTPQLLAVGDALADDPMAPTSQPWWTA